MFDLFTVQNSILLILSLGMFVVKAVAMVDCITRDESQFYAHDTLPKRSWLILLGLALLAHVLFWEPLGLLNLAGSVAALVYLAQMRGSSH